MLYVYIKLVLEFSIFYHSTALIGSRAVGEQ